MPFSLRKQLKSAQSSGDSGVPVVSLITYFGHQDAYVGMMKAVICGICPPARIVDVCHEITPYSIPEAGFVLSQSYRYFPAGSMHVVVVDPGVGSLRRGLLVEAMGHRFVGPDNGVFSMIFREAALQATPGKKRAYSVRVLENPDWILASRGATFDGRDLFAPFAARLAAGCKPSGAGPRVENALRQDWDLPVRTGKRFWSGTVFKTDRFGNLISNFPCAAFPLESATFELQAGTEFIRKVYPCYAEAPIGELFLVKGSAGYWEISQNQGSAAKTVGLISGSPLELTILS